MSGLLRKPRKSGPRGRIRTYVQRIESRLLRLSATRGELVGGVGFEPTVTGLKSGCFDRAKLPAHSAHRDLINSMGSLRNFSASLSARLRAQA
jgi:hypothetical protein